MWLMRKDAGVPVSMGAATETPWAETLEEVFGRVLGDGWWQQVCDEAEARQQAGPNSYYQ